MNDMLMQILNEAFQHVILESSCLRYRYQKEAPWIHQKHRIRTTKFYNASNY